MNALKFLIPSLLAAGMVAVPLDVGAANDTRAPSSVQRGSGFRDTALRSPANTKRSLREDATARTPSFEAFSSQEFGTASLHAKKEVPELSGSAAGASLALVGAGILALTGRRKRKAPAE